MRPQTKAMIWLFGSAFAFIVFNEFAVAPYQLREGLSEFEFENLQLNTPPYLPAVFLGVSLLFVCCGVHGAIMLIEICESDRGNEGYAGSNLGIRTLKVSHETREGKTVG